MSHVQNAAIELMQIRAGQYPSRDTQARRELMEERVIGKPTYSGAIVKGTPEAIAEELKEAFAAVEPGGSRREELMKNIEKLQKVCDADLKPGGRAYEAMERFVNM